MKMILKLTKLFYKEIFSPESYIKDSKTGKVKVGKGILYAILILYCIGVFGFMYFTTISSLYNSLNSIGQGYLTLYAVGFSAFIITFFFGFMVSVNTYATSANEEFLISLPLKIKDIFTAKFLCTIINELLLSVAFIFLGAGIYGFNEGLLTNPLFYIEVIFSAIAIPFFSVGVSYLILVILVNSFKFLRRKGVLTGICTTIMIVFFLWFYFTWQKIFNGAIQENLEQMMNGAEIASLMDKFSVFFPIKWFGESVSLLKTGSILKSLLNFILLIGCSFAIPAIVLPVLAPLYKRSLAGFNETKVKKLEKGTEKEFIQKDLKSSSLTFALLKRDFWAIIREPSWCINGPGMFLVMPVIFGISIVAGLSQADFNFNEVAGMLVAFITEIRVSNPELLNQIWFWLAFGSGLLAATLGTMTSISTTSISREGKGFSNILALPMSMKDFTLAKMIHAMLYSVVGTVFMLILLIVLICVIKLPIQASELFEIFANLIWTSTVVAFLINLIDLFIDTLSPKLKWENPIAVFKNNLTVVLAIFLSWAIIAGIVALAIFFVKQEMSNLVLINAGLTLISVPVWRLYQNFAEKKLRSMY